MDEELVDPFAPASEGAGGTGSRDHELLALSETGVKAGEEDVHPHGVGSVPSEGAEDTVGDLAVTGTGLAEPDPVQRPSASRFTTGKHGPVPDARNGTVGATGFSEAGRTLGRAGAKKGYAAGVGLQRAAKRKKKERETIRVPAVKQTDCPRWMHHRPGVYCKTCGKTP